MAILNHAVGGALVLASVLMCPVGRAARADVDFEKQLDYDEICVVKAFSSSGDVYLKCKDRKPILKTTVALPSNTALVPSHSAPQAAEHHAKRLAEAKLVWGILEFSFTTQLYVLITFNEDKTLIQTAVAYIQPKFDERVGRRRKIEL